MKGPSLKNNLTLPDEKGKHIMSNNSTEVVVLVLMTLWEPKKVNAVPHRRLPGGTSI